MLWILFGVMLLAAAIMVVWPLYRHQRRFSAMIALIVVGIIGISASLYSYIGTPETAPANLTADGSIEAMVASLDDRLQENPDDLNGWKMLGRSYMQMGDQPGAIAAFEKAVALEGSSNGETLVSLGEAVFTNDQTTIGGRAGRLFESGLALAPDNPRALFYAGLAAAQRGDTLLAADRWELLLALSPPEQLQDILRQRVAEWRGGEPTPEQQPPLTQPAGVVAVDIAIGDVTASAIDPAAVVFIIARDPAQPSPPLAVKRRRAGDFPTVVTIADSDAMVPGRLPSAYEQLEIIVRVSASGQPMAQPGDWFGQGSLRPADGASIAIVVDQQVP
jgi:cytochrome c-type biogenesis protein CcmH